MNKVFLKGRLTSTPELKRTSNDIPVTKFTVAVNRRFDREKTDFINCEAWRNTAEFISKFFSKGKEILVVGELHIDKSEKDGKATFFTTVVVGEAEFCGNKGDNTEAKADTESGGKFVDAMEDDTLPF